MQYSWQSDIHIINDQFCSLHLSSSIVLVLDRTSENFWVFFFSLIIGVKDSNILSLGRLHMF